MTIRSRDYLIERFERGDQPTGQDFKDLISSFAHRQDDNVTELVQQALQEGTINVPLPDVLPDLDGRNLRNITVSEWLSEPANFTLVNTSSFNLVGDRESIYPAGRSLRLRVSGTFQYRAVVSASFDAISETTTVVFDQPIPNTILTSIDYGFLLPPAAGGSVRGIDGGIPTLTAGAFTSGANPIDLPAFEDDQIISVVFPDSFAGSRRMRANNGQTMNYIGVSVQGLPLLMVNTGQSFAQMGDPTSNRIGALQICFDTTPPPGYVFLRGQTFGNLNSGAQVRSSHFRGIYNIIRTMPPNTGDEDFDENEVAVLPDARGRFLLGVDTQNNIGYTASRVIGGSGGQHEVTILQRNLPSVNLTTNTDTHRHTQFYGRGQDQFVSVGTHSNRMPTGGVRPTSDRPSNSLDLTNAMANDSHNHSVALGGQDDPLLTVPPFLAMNLIMRYI